MTLKASLEDSLGDFDAQAAFAQLSAIYDGLDLPAMEFDPSTIEEQLATLSSLDTSDLDGGIEAAFQDALSRLDALPTAASLASSVIPAVAALEAAGGEAATALSGLRAALLPPFDASDGGADRLARGMTGLAEMGASPLLALLPAATPGSVIDVLAAGQGIPSLTSAARSLMALAAGVDRAVELREAIGSLPTADRIAALRAEVAEWDPAATVARLGSEDDPDEILADVLPALARIRDLEEALAGLVAGSAALLEAFDLGRLQLDWEAARGELAGFDVEPVRQLVEAVVAGLDGLLRVRPEGVVASADDVAAELAGRFDALGEAMAGIEGERFARAVERGTAQVVGPLRAAGDALAGVRTMITDAEDALADAVGAVDIGAVAASAESLTRPLGQALEAIRERLGDVAAGLGSSAEDAAAAIEELRSGTQAIAGSLATAFAQVGAALDALDLEARAAQVKAALEPTAAALRGVGIDEAAGAAATGIERVAGVIDALPLDLLPDDARSELAAVVEPIRTLDFDAEVTDPLAAQLEDIRAAIDTDVLDQIRAAQGEASAFITSIDPRPHLEALEREAAVALGAIRTVDPDAMLAPLTDAMAQIPPLGALLDPADRQFDELLGRYDSFSPRSLLAPLQAGLAAAKAEVEGGLHLAALEEQLVRARASALAAIEGVSIGRSVDAFVRFAELALPAPGERAGPGIGQLVLRLGGGAAVDARSFARAREWIAGGEALSEARDELGAVRDVLLALRETLRSLDPASIVAELAPGYDAVATAVDALPARGALRRRLRRAMPPSPVPLSDALGRAHGDVLASVTGSLSAASAVAAVDLRPAAAAVDRLSTAFAPLSAVRDWLVAWVRRAGVAEEQDLGAGVRAALAIVGEQVRTTAGARLETRLRGALRTAVSATADALQAALEDVGSTVDALDLEPMVADLEAMHAQRRAELAQLRPSTQLADTAAELRALDEEIRAFDPFSAARPAVEALSGATEAAATELRPTVLLAPVLESYERAAGALVAIDVDDLFGPVLEALAAVSAMIENGVGDVRNAFVRLQAALPGGET